MDTIEDLITDEAPAAMGAALAMGCRFGLERIGAVSQFESFGNENWLLEADEGRRAILRRYVHASPERVRFQLDFQRRLHAAGLPVATVLATKAGADAELDAAGVPWAGFGYVEGREYNFSMADAVQAGRRLAELHQLGAPVGGVPPLAHRPPLRHCWVHCEEDVEGLRSLLTGADVAEELAYLKAWWRHVRAEWPIERFDALPSGLVHGDFHGRNTAYDEEGTLVAIFDFDDVEPGPFVQDLAWGAHKFGRESRFLLSLRPDVVQAFIEAYEAVRPLTGEERAALPAMIATCYPPNPRYYRYYRDHHGTNIVNRLRREVGLMRHLRSEVARLWPSGAG